MLYDKKLQLHPLLHDKQAGNYPGRYILKIMCGQMHGVCFTGCGSIFLLQLNRRRCFRCIYRHGNLIRAMVNAVASSASNGSFDLLGYLPGTSREIDLAVERIIICCDATFLLQLNHRRC
jgi:hypothetical protein